MRLDAKHILTKVIHLACAMRPLMTQRNKIVPQAEGGKTRRQPPLGAMRDVVCVEGQFQFQLVAELAAGYVKHRRPEAGCWEELAACHPITA